MDGKYSQNKALNVLLLLTGKRAPRWNLLSLVSRFSH